MDKISSPNIVALSAFQKDITCMYAKHQENMTSAY